MNDLCTDIGYRSINHAGEELCGDHIDIAYDNKNSTVIVLADGLGSGVKASILSTLTSKIISTLMAAVLSIEYCVSTIAATLPVCSVRGVAYSTFTIIHIVNNEYAEIIQYDNPQVFILRDGKNYEYPREDIIIGEKKIYKSKIRLMENDLFVAMSDGCPHAGIGLAYNFGWKREDIINFMETIECAGYNSKTLATILIDECYKLYGGNPGDDATACVVRIRKRNPMNILFGPPSNKDDANKMMSLFFSKEGKHIICGGTTSSIAAKYLGKDVRTTLNFESKEIPPIAEIDGVDLVTEGVITVNKVLEYAKDFLSENTMHEQWEFGRDGASLISRLLFEEATDINFYVGRAVNPAHQNPDLPINFNIKMNLVKELSECLKLMGKRIKVSYFKKKEMIVLRKFDTKVQYLKYKVLRTVARFAWEDTLLENVADIPELIVPGPDATMRCCVYKERAILSKRVKIAMGGDHNKPNVIEVISIACDECPMGGYEVTNACRGCLAHRCEDVCKRGAITFDSHQKAHIDKSKCVECGACAKVCPYSAITHNKRPCQNACKVKAITMDDKKAAYIDNDKCISCGACVYQCPFGAIMDKSYILNAIDIIKKSDNNKKYKVYAVVAPSISSQFTYAKLGQVISGIKELGFFTVIEAALGADMVAASESKELYEKGFLTSSCCPGFVTYIKQSFPELLPVVSHNPSPMAAIAAYIKQTDPESKVVFIGPCTAKKAEAQLENVKPYVDTVLTFEELQALFDSRDIDINSLEEDVLDNASYFGRIFARSGGLSDAVAQGLKEQGLDDFALKAVTCDGIEECRVALLKKSKNVLEGNFIEGMACVGGCIGGAGCLTHGVKDKNEVDKYGKEAYEKTISDAISILKSDTE